jgi:23S rRNA pseudouridine2605 synthase
VSDLRNERPMPERRTLDRLLSRLGLCSRTVAAGLVRAGRVRVAGRLVRDPDTWVQADGRDVTLDRRPVRAARGVYLALNKPKGFLTSFGDPDGRRTVYALLGELDSWVFPVGRLDRDTTGLLLLTNDTDFAARVTAPEHAVSKTYRATVVPRIEDAELAPLRTGIELDDGPTRPATVVLVGHRGPTTVVELTITEGRNRQVRRMFRALGHRVRELRRVAIGPVTLDGLTSGTWRHLDAAERSALG